jgi:uncharacterized protein YdaU (DUF1376 family)
MNSDAPRGSATLAYAVGILGAFLIVAALVAVMQRYSIPAPIDEGRAAARAKALVELRAAESEALRSPAWIDQAKGVARLRIEDAMKLVERDWAKNPGAARSNLIARVVKATFVPPPKPSEFE